MCTLVKWNVYGRKRYSSYYHNVHNQIFPTLMNDDRSNVRSASVKSDHKNLFTFSLNAAIHQHYVCNSSVPINTRGLHFVSNEGTNIKKCIGYVFCQLEYFLHIWTSTVAIQKTTMYHICILTICDEDIQHPF